MKYTSINIHGNLISEEILKKVEDGTAVSQAAKDFGLDSSTQLRGEIEYAWSRIRLDWKYFSEKMESLPSSDQYGTTLARKWMNGFFSALGFELSQRKASLPGSNNQSYTISHTADHLDELPIHIVGFSEPTLPGRNTLDIKTSGGTSRLSPHGLMQEYLNVTDHLYGMVTNGISIRLMRDSGRLIKLVYIEFDLRRMLEEDKYSEFTILYRLLHSSRFPKNRQEAEQCPLEKYFRESIETGNRIRDGLSKAVEESLVSLGNGLLQHQFNNELRQKLQNKNLSVKDFYRQLLRFIYRLLFLMVTEERDLIYDPEEKSEDIAKKRRYYFDHYSIARLRRLCRLKYLYEPQYDDLWQGLMATFRLFEENGGGVKLGIQPLAGELFNHVSIRDIEGCRLKNDLLLQTICNMNEFVDKEGNTVSINYRALDVEELGSVYEGLLELHPLIENLDAPGPSQINFLFHEGTDRKTTGSYYTRPDLVNELIKSALIPVIQDRLKQNTGKKEAQEHALLQLKVCDPACGSGHMVLAAARAIAWELACVRSGESNPAPSVFRTALREVIQHCVYAVDLNPDAVELCKLSLWLESHNSGKPISFLNHKIKCGNSLVGITDLTLLNSGIPEDAYNPITGDEKGICSFLKKENDKYRIFLSKRHDIGFQSSFQFDVSNDSSEFSEGFQELEFVKQDNVQSVHLIESKYEQLKKNKKWLNDKIACDIWTSAFFFKYNSETYEYAPLSERLQKFITNPSAVDGRLIGEVGKLTTEIKFFHWPLEFPDVFANGGFDVMLGNPPWERIKIQETEFFSARDSTIALTDKKSERKRLIQLLPETNPGLFEEFQTALHSADAQSKFIRFSNRFPLTAIGDINTYAIFAEHFYKTINPKGRMSVLLPTGIATDESTSIFFREIVEQKRLESFWGYKNERFLFPKPVEHTVTFGILNIRGKENPNNKLIECCWLAYSVEEANDPRRRIQVSNEDLKILNPNTFTAPIPRTQIDLNLLLKFYKSHQILVNRTTKNNPWKIKFSTCFHMSNDSEKFVEYKDLVEKKHIDFGGILMNADLKFLPLYESKMVREYDHRFGSYYGFNSRSNSMLPTPSIGDYCNPKYYSRSWYWVNKNEVLKRLADVPNIVSRVLEKEPQHLKAALLIWIYNVLSLRQGDIRKEIQKTKKYSVQDIQSKSEEALKESSLKEEEAMLLEKIINSESFKEDFLNFLESRCPKYLFGFRNNARSTDERTGIFSVIPFSAVSNGFPLINVKYPDKIKALYLIANLCSLPFDWVIRQKIAGVNLNFFYVEQLPIISPEEYGSIDNFKIAAILTELFYTSWDLKALADDIWKESNEKLRSIIKSQWEQNNTVTAGHAWDPPEWCEIDKDGFPLPPFKWDEDRRAVLKAELDAIYAQLYGLTTDELRYILDPQDVYGPDFPGETFRVLKEKEIRTYGEYRTKRLVLEAWERMNYDEVQTPLIKETEETIINLPAMKEFSLDEGIYSVQDVVQITHLSSDKVRRWFRELSKENYQGLSFTQQSDIESMRICFHGLIELVVIGTLRENGFTLKKILKARTDLQLKTKKIFPFATNNVKDNLKIIEKSIIFKFPTGLVTLDGTGQYNLSFIEQFFQKIEFNLEGIAYRIFPLHNSKLIVIDPSQAGGKAVINGKGVWVESISLAYSGEKSLSIIQEQYDLRKEEVLAALEYYKEENKLW